MTPKGAEVFFEGLYFKRVTKGESVKVFYHDNEEWRLSGRLPHEIDDAISLVELEEAKARQERNGLRHSHNKLCRKAVQDNPGVSSARIAQITGLDRHQAARRLSDLNGISVEQGEPVRCKLCRGQLCVTWWPMNNKTTIGAK